jgi:hypothetical protein
MAMSPSPRHVKGKIETQAANDRFQIHFEQNVQTK